ncbi:hypothetical protein C8F04DRAFT_1123774 [Mycena alexandri]|uniref:F-box domain-containing protein n=1 Tax=Mycena alexandri TaxID=1745969 RepID=A0AAD6SFZ3_9AGAR|nr:hypothetical protein C8F04DRAFT_1123774 [Mycena alexandri]
MLPLELFQAIAGDLQNDPSIVNLRLVSKSINSVATPLAFRVVVVSDSLQSAAAVTFLQSCDESITSHVREVIFQGDLNGETGEDQRAALRNTFSGLAKFSMLESLRLNLHDTYEEELVNNEEVPECPSHFLLLQREIFAGLAENPPSSLLSLTLNNVIAVPNEIYSEEDFHRIFRSLQKLEISVLSIDADEGAHLYDSAILFWDESVPPIVRSATALTSLKIYSDQPVGSMPAMSFEDMFLPHLTSLTLHRFVFGPGDPDNFILCHKATLVRLELRESSIDCGIVDFGQHANYPCPWHAILARFEAELTGLHEFVFETASGPDDDMPWRDPRFKYTREDPGFGFLDWDKPIPGEDQDLPALESLLATVNSRRNEDSSCSSNDVRSLY